jgi:pimeloyl-ACP methyl ester carboxylesterase
VNESDDEVTMPAGAIEVAQVKGIERGYQVFGEGEPLILLHGGFGTMEMFGPNLQLLAAGRQVIGADLQSHGRSPAADRPMRFETIGRRHRRADPRPRARAGRDHASSWSRPCSIARAGTRR